MNELTMRRSVLSLFWLWLDHKRKTTRPKARALLSLSLSLFDVRKRFCFLQNYCSTPKLMIDGSVHRTPPHPPLRPPPPHPPPTKKNHTICGVSYHCNLHHNNGKHGTSVRIGSKKWILRMVPLPVNEKTKDHHVLLVLFHKARNSFPLRPRWLCSAGTAFMLSSRNPSFSRNSSYIFGDTGHGGP